MGTNWASSRLAQPLAGDFNGDGKTDIAISAWRLGGVGVYLSNGDGTFTPVYSAQAGTDWVSWPNAKPLIGDFNGDGLGSPPSDSSRAG
jgi:VCBS repeat protein